MVWFGSHEFVATFAMNSPASGSPPARPLAPSVDRDVWLDCPDTHRPTDASGTSGDDDVFGFSDVGRSAASVSLRLLPCALPLGQHGSRTFVLKMWAAKKPPSTV